MLYNREFYENNIGNDLSCSSQEDIDQIVQNNPKLIVQILQDENILEDIITPQNKERKYRKTSNRRAAPRNRNESYVIEEMDLLNDSQMSFPGSTNDSVAWQLTHVYTAIVQKNCYLNNIILSVMKLFLRQRRYCLHLVDVELVNKRTHSIIILVQ